MSIVRRLVPQVGMATVARMGWNHRASLLRLLDLAGRVPPALRDGRTSELLTEARAVLALDAVLPTDRSVRISGLDDGQVTLRHTGDATTLSLAEEQLRRVAQITDVRTDGAELPTAEATLAAART